MARPDDDLQALIDEARSDPEARLGSYLLLRQVGVGNFGTVYKAWDPELETVVAVKVLNKLNATLRQRFVREIKAGDRLDHPHIVGVHDSGEHKRQPYLVMELVEGDSLKALAGKLEPRRAAELIHQVAQGVAFAHAQGIVHRDLKPENVLVDAASGDAKILDFGLARFTLPDGPKLTKTGEMIGSPLFMAPEQSAGVFDARTDVYAVGATLYYALCARAPLAAKDLDEYLDQLEREYPPPPSGFTAQAIPRDLETICLHCLEKDPDRRYPSAAAVAEDLGRFLAGQPIEAQPPSGLERGLRWAHRARRRLLIAGALIIVAVIIAVALQ